MHVCLDGALAPQSDDWRPFGSRLTFYFWSTSSDSVVLFLLCEQKSVSPRRCVRFPLSCSLAMADATGGAMNGIIEALRDNDDSGAQGREKVPRIENTADVSGGGHGGATSSSAVALPGDGGGSVAETPTSVVLGGVVDPEDQRQVMSPNIGEGEHSRGGLLIS